MVQVRHDVGHERLHLLKVETIYNGHWANLYSGIAPAADWTRYTTGFTMPANAEYAYFVHFIRHDGYLQTDDTRCGRAMRRPASVMRW